MICFAIRDYYDRYYCGYNIWNDNIKNAQLFVTKKNALKCSKRYPERQGTIVRVSIEEVGECAK